jgi:hypothetical protein
MTQSWFYLTMQFIMHVVYYFLITYNLDMVFI